MAVAVGDNIPDVEVRVLNDEGAPTPVQTGDVLGSGKVVLFAVPGAFTPGCSKVHMPGFVQNKEELAAKGVEKVACISVNDAFVMDAWGKAAGSADVQMLADGNGAFAKAMGLEMDGSGFGLGTRCQRFAMVVDNGTITHINVEEPGAFEVSSGEYVLNQL